MNYNQKLQNNSNQLYRAHLFGLVECLSIVFNQKKYADKVLENHFFHHREMGSKDRKFFSEAFYEMVRWWSKLVFAIDPKGLDSSYNWDTGNLKNVVSLWCVLNGYKLEQFSKDGFKVDNRSVDRFNGAMPAFVFHGFPEWIWNLCEKQLGKDLWLNIAIESNKPAPLFLRVNKLKTTREKLILQLKEEGIDAESIDESELAVVIPVRKNVFQTRAFKNGLFEVQDLGSQQIVPLLDVKPGQRIIDACAGAGGKSLHCSSLMNNQGKIISLDIHEWKLKDLKLRARRNGVDIVETRWIENNKVIKRLKDTADRLLLDVPCSGLGVIRRNPDSKWKLNEDELNNLMQTQKDILKNYSSMVKKDGILVYATCSVLPSENEEQIKWFLDANNNWELLQELKLYPSENGGDGFYAAKMKRND